MAESFGMCQANGQGSLGREPTSPQLICSTTVVTSHPCHSSCPRLAGFAGLPGMLQGPLLQSRRARLQTNRILSWARAAPRTGNRAAFQTPCCLADVIPPSPQVWPGPGTGAGKRRGLGGASWGESAGHSESSGLLSPFHR